MFYSTTGFNTGVKSSMRNEIKLPSITSKKCNNVIQVLSMLSAFLIGDGLPDLSIQVQVYNSLFIMK